MQRRSITTKHTKRSTCKSCPSVVQVSALRPPRSFSRPGQGIQALFGQGLQCLVGPVQGLRLAVALFSSFSSAFATSLLNRPSRLRHNVEGLHIAEELPDTIGAAKQKIIFLKIQPLDARP